MKKAAIVIDRWKLKIFKKVLDDAGYKYTVSAGVGVNTASLFVETDDFVKLASIIKQAQIKAAN